MRIKPRWVILGASAVAVTASLADNNWDANAIGVVRFGRAALTAAAIAADYKFRVYNKEMPNDEEEVNRIWSAAHRRSAERLLDLARANKGVFVKVGQHLGALDYLLPPEYIETLRILHSQAPSSPLKDVFQVLKEDLQVDQTEKIFKSFDPEPLGAASLAQVYKAELKTGETVAVKIQHRKVLPHSKVDIKTMEVLVKIAAWIFPDFKLLWLAEETKKNLPMELDFLHEARNADKMRSLTEDCEWIKVPKIYWEMSTRRVLTMEFCEGAQINDLKYFRENNISTKEICEKLGLLYSDMIFSHGFVHCDPHPGNIIIRKNPDNKVELCLLDHGLYTTLSDEFRYSYSQLWLSILNSDVNGIKKHSEELGVGEMYGLFACMVTGRSWESITSKDGITKVKLTKKEENAIRKNVGSYLPQISEILARVPKPMILIFKTNDLIRGVEAALKNQKSMYSFMTMSKFCTRAVYKEKMKYCSSYYCMFRYKFIETWTLAKISVFQWILWLRSFIQPYLPIGIIM